MGRFDRQGTEEWMCWQRTWGLSSHLLPFWSLDRTPSVRALPQQALRWELGQPAAYVRPDFSKTQLLRHLKPLRRLGLEIQDQMSEMVTQSITIIVSYLLFFRQLLHYTDIRPMKTRDGWWEKRTLGF
jgi:hypothetical protein